MYAHAYRHFQGIPTPGTGYTNDHVRMRATLSAGSPAVSYQFRVEFSLLWRRIWTHAQSEASHPPACLRISKSQLFTSFNHMRKGLAGYFYCCRERADCLIGFSFWLSWRTHRKGLSLFSSEQQFFEDPSPCHLTLPWVRGLTWSFAFPYVVSSRCTEWSPARRSVGRDSFSNPPQWEAITSLLQLLLSPPGPAPKAICYYPAAVVPAAKPAQCIWTPPRTRWLLVNRRIF